MSESQFEYGSFTLDELRSLAASPQVGTMQAMPQSFRALADRVGEVADLLSHAQADLPNWWKGPAAEQAAATLGRAAAEAREFHDSAMGAATTVGRCAQVVAEQQNQMMNVPDVQEPGVSAVVQRPATPFEALEAARQDAAYRAAHEQAVQVVNGIAAQYVETRAALSTISAAKGENFASAAASPSEGFMNQTLMGEPNMAKPQVVKDGDIDQLRPYRRVAGRANTAELDAGISQRQVHSQRAFHPHAGLGNESPTTPGRVTSSVEWESGAPARPAGELSGTQEAPINPQQAIYLPVESSIEPEPLAVSSSGRSATNMAVPLDVRDPSGTLHFEPSRQSPSATPTKKTIRTSNPERGAANDLKIEGTETLVSDDPIKQGTPRPSDRAQGNMLGNDNESAAIIPPYGGIGSVRRASEERNPRPAYLKERKSVWLPDTVAVPADGIISPDWLNRP